MDRRQLVISGALGAGAGVLLGRQAVPSASVAIGTGSVDFDGRHQAGIVTPPQAHAIFAAFDLRERSAHALRRTLDDWTVTARDLARGRMPEGHTGEATGLGPARLTITFAFGSSLFDDMAAPRSERPPGLIDLPPFPGDVLEPEWGGGDLLVQVCADDRTVASHALRQLRRRALGVMELRWMQSAFLPIVDGATPRNLFGQPDGTANPVDPSDVDPLVWVDGDGWMDGGTFLATRRIRMMLTMWDRMGLEVQEAVVGRDRETGAPLSGGSEFTPLDLDAAGPDGPLIADDAHVRIAAGAGPGMLRRGYSFDNGPRPVAGGREVGGLGGEPDHDVHAGHGAAAHQGMVAAMDDHDAGLFFAAFVRDPAEQFVPMQMALSERDALGHFLAYTSADLWAVPGGSAGGPLAADLGG